MPSERIGLAADHAGFALKEAIRQALSAEGYRVEDFGAKELVMGDDYPDYVIPLAQSVARGDTDRGIAICGSGVGASVAANKVRGIRAGLCHDTYSAHQGVEDDDMNILVLGGRVIGPELAQELVRAFLGARFSGEARHRRRLDKIKTLEDQT